MLDIHTAHEKVLDYVKTLETHRELIVERDDETENEWVFRWNSKRYHETGDIFERLISTRPIAVNKTSGEFCEPSKQYTWGTNGSDL